MRPTGDFLETIRITGNRAIARETLEPGLALYEAQQSGAPVDPFLVARDADRIRAAYWRRGFFEAQVATRVDRHDHAQVVVFAVVEGRRAVTRVEIEGLPPEVPAAEARALVALADGAPFDYDAYDAAKLPMSALVENAGYAHVDVRARVLADKDAARATARYEVVAGPRCTFGEIRISGVTGDLAAAARARMAFATGDRYSATALERSQTELYQLGRFATVQVVPKRGDAAAPGTVPGAVPGAVIDVAVELSEANRHELHGGGGVGYEPATVELRVRGGGSLVPASQPLLTFASDARVALTAPHSVDLSQLEPRVRGLASIQQLDLVRPRLRGEVEVGADYQTVEAYTWTGTHLRLGLGSPLGARWLQLRVGWRIDAIKFTNPDCALGVATGCDAVPPGAMAPPGPCDAGDTLARRLGLCETLRLGAYQASLVADGRDNPIEPHHGLYAIAPISVGTPYAGGELRYVQIDPELRGYLTLAGVVIAARVRLGAIFADTPGDVPVTERYFSGGTSGHRGFSDRRLARTARAGDHTVVYGGAGLIETGIELRRQIGVLWGWPLGANVFLDGGDVTEVPGDLDLGRLYWGVGAGVWVKPVGAFKIRIDAGYLLPSTGADPPMRDGLDQFILHLGIGESY